MHVERSISCLHLAAFSYFALLLYCLCVSRQAQFGTPIEKIYEGVKDGVVLGSGVSGVVRLCVHRATGAEYAVKCLDLGAVDSIEQLQALRSEISIMCQLDHPFIVRISEVYESANEIYIVMELCSGGVSHQNCERKEEISFVSLL